MLAFEVSVNGKRVCTATAESVLATIVSWSSRTPDRIQFHVGGIPETKDGEHIDWETPCIRVGDEVTIRILEADSADPPGRKYKPSLEHDDSEESARL
jgi:hypothetical protein